MFRFLNFSTVACLRHNFQFAFASAFLFAFCILFSLPSSAFADESAKPPRTVFESVNIFKDKRSPTSFFGKNFDGEVIDLTEDQTEEKTTEKVTSKKPDSFAQNEQALNEELRKERKLILGKVSKDSSEPFKDMVAAYRKGNQEEANKAADRYVAYLANLMFELRDLTKMIGQAMIRQNLAEEEDWVGVEQFLDYQFAKGTESGNSLLKVTHDEAMKRIVPDEKGQAEIYYFFTLNCKWCRDMAPDVERLWQVAQGDPRLKMVALTLGPQPKDWIDSYRNYTGLTVPIMEGAKIAKSFNIAFAPAIVIVTPGNNTAYIKTGKQEFERLYEFVRTSQGLPSNITTAVTRLMNTPIGRTEKEQVSGKNILVRNNGGEKGLINSNQIIDRF